MEKFMKNSMEYTQLLDMAENRLMLEKSLVKKSNIDNRDREGRNALYWAIKTSHKHNIEVLLKENISLMVKPHLHALFHTIRNNNLDFFLYLLQIKEDINMKNGSMQSLLMVAIEERNVMMVRYLISHGINLQIQDNRGRVALDYAKHSNNQMIYDLVYYKLMVTGEKVLRR